MAILCGFAVPRHLSFYGSLVLGEDQDPASLKTSSNKTTVGIF
jgi:hypothetical protein